MKNISVTNSDRCLTVDDEDFSLLQGYKWALHHGYIHFTKKPQTAIHRLIMGAKKGEIIDHINGDIFDNRRCNLRFATNQQNMCNRRVQSNNNTGYTGVSWYKNANKYRASIKFQGKTIRLGYFTSPEEARDAYIEASNKYFGEYSCHNSRGMPSMPSSSDKSEKRISVGDLIKFKSETRRYTVQACDDRFVVCTKPFNVRKTVLYTIVDIKEKVRGTEDLIFCMGLETRELCEKALERIANGESEISHRNRIELDIESVTHLKEEK